MISRPFRNARILIVDDENDNVEILRRVLTRAGFAHIESTTDSRQAKALYIKHKPDLDPARSADAAPGRPGGDGAAQRHRRGHATCRS